MDHLPLTRPAPFEEIPDPESPVVHLDVLFADLPVPGREFEVILTAPRQDGGEPLVPVNLPAGVLGCWSAESAVVSVTVCASRASSAVAAVEALVPELAGRAGATFEVRAAPA